MEKVKEFFMNKFYYPVRGFYRSVRRVLDYLPVIWNNYDWDQGYMLQLFAFKLRRMQKSFENDKWHTDANKTARQIQICAFLLERLAGDELERPHWDEFYKTYPTFGTFSTDENGYSSMRDREKWGKEFKRLNDHDEVVRKQDLELFWKIFSKNYQRWWS